MAAFNDIRGVYSPAGPPLGTYGPPGNVIKANHNYTELEMVELVGLESTLHVSTGSVGYIVPHPTNGAIAWKLYKDGLLEELTGSAYWRLARGVSPREFHERAAVVVTVWILERM